MATWKDYKNHVRKSNPDIGKDIDKAEEKAKNMSAVIDKNAQKSSNYHHSLK
jgi:hypothetical protein